MSRVSQGATVANPTITLGPSGTSPLPARALAALVRTVIDTDLNQPDMFEITFLDPDAQLVMAAGFAIGTRIKLAGSALGERSDAVLLDGEITAFEGRCEYMDTYLVVRGYDLSHRLQRVRRTRAFLNTSDSDIARSIARGAGLTELQIEPSEPVHNHVSQIDETDWDFLTGRAREIDFETGISAGVFYFRRASAVGAARRAAVELTFRETLRTFRPRVSAGNLTPEVEVRVWDPMQARVVASTRRAHSDTAEIAGETAPAVAGMFVARQAEGAPTRPLPVGVGSLGPAPEPTALVVSDRPVATGSAIDSAASALAEGVASRLASTFAEAEGEAHGDPKIQAGSVISVSGVAEIFRGPWLVTTARHIFDIKQGGYRTVFVASGRNDRSLLALSSGGAQRRRRQLDGVYCAIVTNNHDQARLRRVKVALPWLSPDFETDWAPVVQVFAGKHSGAMFLPEVGDEVIVGFEFGDPRRPYVLGGVVNSTSSYSLGDEPVKATGQAAQVVRRGLVSATGNVLVFEDEQPPGDGPASCSAITLGTGNKALALHIDQVAGTVTLTCEPRSPASRTDKGTINIRCADGGTVNIAAGTGGCVTIDGGARLELKAQESMSLDTSGELKLKGSRITLN